jgi:hypothetical protein
VDASLPKIRRLRATPVNVPLGRPHPTASWTGSGIRPIGGGDPTRSHSRFIIAPLFSTNSALYSCSYSIGAVLRLISVPFYAARGLSSTAR